MVGAPLNVKKRHFRRFHGFNKVHEGNFAGVSFGMEHRFPSKEASYTNAVEAAYQAPLGVVGLNRMGPSEFMKSGVGSNEGFGDSRAFTFLVGTCIDDAFKVGVEAHFKAFCALAH